jgi:ribosomal protein L11 methyltransferase
VAENRNPGGETACADRIRDAVSQMVAGADRRLTPLQVSRSVSRRLGVGRHQVHRAILSLVQEGRLAYAQRLGTAFLEMPFWGPVRIAERIWICPAGIAPPGNASPDRLLIRVQHGAAFGRGDHPSTRLALRGLAFAAANAPAPPQTALDIGTGTGVLAIAAALLGGGRVLALDTDPCARTEAAANVAENGLAGKIQIADIPMDRIRGSFPLVLANLRPPTLSKLADVIDGFSGPAAFAVFSGFRPSEWAALAEQYRTNRWRACWSEKQNGWAAVVCKKTR